METLEGLPKNAGLDGAQPETLAKRLTAGPLPLAYALQCATAVANSLRTLHDEGRVHGSVSASSVIVTNAGAQLLPPNGHARYTVPGADVSAFGSLLHEMLTGSKPSPRSTPPLPPITSRNTEKGIQIAAARLASKCLRSTSNSSAEMQKVLTEVRLLSLQAKTRKKSAYVPPIMAIAKLERHNPANYTPADRAVAQRIFTTVPAGSFMATKDIDTLDPPPSGVRCPMCGVPYVYPSRPRSWFETMLNAWGSPLLRCHRCLHRYVTVMGRFNFSKGSPLKPNRSSELL